MKRRLSTAISLVALVLAVGAGSAGAKTWTWTWPRGTTRAEMVTLPAERAILAYGETPAALGWVGFSVSLRNCQTGAGRVVACTVDELLAYPYVIAFRAYAHIAPPWVYVSAPEYAPDERAVPYVAVMPRLLRRYRSVSAR